MVLTLSDILSPEAAAQLCASLQLDEKEASQHAATAITEGLLSNPLFVLGVQPYRTSLPVFRCFTEGLEGEAITGDAIVGVSQPLRADVGIVVLLSDPGSYEGGAVILDTGYEGEQRREGAGSC